MAQKLEIIVKLLREMNRANDSVAQSFTELIDNVRSKKELLDKNMISVELIKAYLNEALKSITGRQASVSTIFRDLEPSLKRLSKEGHEHVRNTELQNIFKRIDKNISHFYKDEAKFSENISEYKVKIEKLGKKRIAKKTINNIIDTLPEEFSDYNEALKNNLATIATDLRLVTDSLKTADQTTFSYNMTNEISIFCDCIDKLTASLVDAEKREKSLDKILTNVSTNESLKLNQGITEAIIEKYEEISTKISNLASKQDLQDALDEAGAIELFEKITTKTDDLVNQTNEVKQTLVKVTKNIEDFPDTKILETSLQELFRKLASFSDEINNAASSENLRDIENKILTLMEDITTIKNIISDLNEVVSGKIINAINDVSFEGESYDIKTHISKMLSQLPQKEDIDQLLENTVINQGKLDEIIEKADSISDRLEMVTTSDEVSDLSAKTDEIEKMIDKINFDDEFDNLYKKTADIETWLNDSKIKENTEEILTEVKASVAKEDLAPIATTTEEIATTAEEIASTTEEIHKKASVLDEKLVTISEYLNNIPQSDNSELQKTISEIKEFLENKRSNFDEIDNTNKAIISSVESYLNEIKEILDTSDNSLSEEILKKIETLELQLERSNSTSENALTEIIAKIDEFGALISTKEIIPQANLSDSAGDIAEIKNQIKALSDSFSALNYEQGSTENVVSDFVAKKLTELGDNLDLLTSNIENQLQHGFTYNAELVEEKTATLLELIKELRHGNTENIELYERLTVADTKLLDYKQELELINTDIISNLNSNTERLLSEIEPLKTLVSSISGASDTPETNIKEHLGIIHDSVQDDLIECTKYSKSTYDKLENTYEQITRDLTKTENNLRDFILGDIDSVIIKIDNLKADLDDALERISPPEAEHMAEFKVFVDEITNFKEEQKTVITQAAEDIKTSINEQITTSHEELKSMITVAMNNKQIIHAINDLKKCFKSKVKELSRLQSEKDDKDFANIDEFDSNQYEKAFETDKNVKIIEELKEDFNKFSELIKELSDENPEIEEVLNVIKGKMDSVSVIKAEMNPEIIEEDETSTDSDTDSDTEMNEVLASESYDEDFDDDYTYDTDDDDDEIIVGTDNFDFLKALDLLKQDIQNLHKDVEKFITREEQQKTINAIPTLGSDKLLLSLNNKIELLAKNIQNKDWLEEIKTYISGENIHSMLEEISGKIDILTLSDNSEWIGEIKQALEQLNGDIGGDASSNEQIQTMLALINEKIDILAASDDYELMEEVRDAIERLENTESDSLLNVINEKIDIIAASDNINEFEDIKDSLYALEEKIDKLEETAGDATSADLDDIKYTLLNVDEKVDSVKKLSESDAKITQMLESLNHKIDVIATDDSETTKANFEDVKHLIVAQMNYIEKLDKNNKTDAFKKCLNELTLEVNNLNTKDNTKQIQKTLKDMKESIMAAVVTIFEQVSFVEESEDIKDFVEEKTDEINQSLVAVTKQLKQITNSNEDPDYTYSMQDIESDLAKLRLALNNLQENEQETQAARLSYILDNINQIGTSVEDLQNSLTKEEVFGMKVKFDRINTDIKSLNALTNQLLVKSGESYEAITDQLSAKVDKVTALLENSNASDKVMRQALIYMGEWIDSASESMNKISTNSDEIGDIKTAIENLKESVPEQTDILNSIEEKFDEQQERLSFFEKQLSKLGGLEDKFEQQQERIDRLEIALEKILSAVEDIDDSKVSRKIDKLDKQLAKLSTNIEKLASYVD